MNLGRYRTLPVTRDQRRTVRLRNTTRLAIPVILIALPLIVAGCGDDSASGGDGTTMSGSIDVDGSSTVGPMVTYAAELFQEENPDVQATVGISGTGGGFERFCVGETDLSNASRPIKPERRRRRPPSVPRTESSTPSSRLQTTASRSSSTRRTTGPRA